MPSVSYAWNNKTRSLAEGLESKYVFIQPRQRIGLHLTHRVFERARAVGI